MSVEFYIQTIIEVLLSLFVIYGLLHEDKFINFEDNIKRIIKRKYKRFKRKSRYYIIWAFKAIRCYFFYKKWRKINIKYEKYKLILDETESKYLGEKLSFNALKIVKKENNNE